MSYCTSSSGLNYQWGDEFGNEGFFFDTLQRSYQIYQIPDTLILIYFRAKHWELFRNSTSESNEKWIKSLPTIVLVVWLFDPQKNDLEVPKMFKSTSWKEKSSDEFHSRWLNLQGVDATFPISLTLFTNHLNWNWST